MPITKEMKASNVLNLMLKIFNQKKKKKIKKKCAQAKELSLYGLLMYN